MRYAQVSILVRPRYLGHNPAMIETLKPGRAISGAAEPALQSRGDRKTALKRYHPVFEQPSAHKVA